MAGCATIPKAEYRVEREVVLPYTFDSAWESALNAVKKIDGRVINADKDSGVIVYASYRDDAKSWLYANVYLRRPDKEGPIKIVFVPKTLRGYCMNDAERDFFQALSPDSSAGSSAHRAPKPAGRLPPEERFYDFETPDAGKIKEKGENKEFSHISFDKVWDGLIAVAIQEGVVVKTSKEKGVIVIASHPFIMSVLVEKSRAINVYTRLDSIDEIVSGASGDSGIKLKLASSASEGRIKLFLECLATEVYASERWKYLI
jgi:hypothetical protein